MILLQQLYVSISIAVIATNYITVLGDLAIETFKEAEKFLENGF